MFNQRVTGVIDSVEQDIEVVEDLLGQSQSETLIADDITIPAPTYDTATGVYTLSQNTANNGVYEGVYRIPATDGCAELEVVQIVSHTAPPSGAPARTRLCGQGVYTDQTSVSALTGKEVTAFSIRSGSPFQVKVKVVNANAWCYSFDFALGQQGWTTVQNWPGGGGAGAEWTGSAWTSRQPGGYGGSSSTLLLIRNWTPATKVNSVTLYYQKGQLSYASGGYEGVLTQSSPYTANLNLANQTGVSFQIGNAVGDYIMITKVIIDGAGTNPFGSRNC